MAAVDLGLRPFTRVSGFHEVRGVCADYENGEKTPGEVNKVRFSTLKTQEVMDGWFWMNGWMDV